MGEHGFQPNNLTHNAVTWGVAPGYGAIGRWPSKAIVGRWLRLHAGLQKNAGNRLVTTAGVLFN
jgi:hypothetical protein